MTNPTQVKYDIGDRVIRENTFIQGINDRDTFDLGTECGIVIHTWDDNGIQDCYVAFFGDKFPVGKPETKPYILRYWAGSLKKAR